MFRYLMFALGLCSASVQAQSVAITFDDGPQMMALPRLSPQQRNACTAAP